MREVLITAAGLVTLFLLFRQTRTALFVRSQNERLMSHFNLASIAQKVDATVADALYERGKRTEDTANEEYVELLRTLGVTSVGDTFQLPLETITVGNSRKRKNADGSDMLGQDGKPVMEDYEEDVEILAGSLAAEDDNDAEDQYVSVRMAKRRFQVAAKSLGFRLEWKEPKGWLIGRAYSSKVKVTSEAATEATAEVPATTVQSQAPTPPAASQTQSVASNPAGGRRIVRRG